MKTKAVNRYNYTDLLRKATAPDAEQIDIDTLGVWFERYGSVYWNGEFYYADEDRKLFPVIEHDEERDLYETVRYEFR